MTEYDYSPAAMKAHLAKQARISKWAEKTDGHKHHLTNPFVLSPSVAALQCKPVTRSEIYGPDRPPSPPASAPPYGYGGGGGYFGMQHYPGYGSSPVQSPNPSGPISPTWNGYAWVYPTHQPAAPHQSSSRRHHSSSSRRNSINGHSSRRNSISTGYPPPPPPRPQQHRSYSMGHLPSPVQVYNVPAGSSSPVRLSKYTSISQSPAYQVLYPTVQQPLSGPPIVYVDGAPVGGGRRSGRKLRKDRY